MLTPADLDALEQLERKATAGPWIQSEREPHRVLDVAGGFVVADAMSTPSLDGRSLKQRASDQSAFIVSARNALPDLIRLARIGMAAEQAQERGA